MQKLINLDCFDVLAKTKGNLRSKFPFYTQYDIWKLSISLCPPKRTVE